MFLGIEHFQVQLKSDPNYKQSRLTIEHDPNGERVMVMDRNTGRALHQFKVRTPIMQFYLPERFSRDAHLLCLLLDDDGEFNAAVQDNVKAELINPYTNEVISQP